MAKKKTKTQRIKEEIFETLQSRYHLSGRELASGSLFYGDGNILPEEVLPELEREYGITLEKKDFSNWSELVESIARKVDRKRKF